MTARRRVAQGDVVSVATHRRFRHELDFQHAVCRLLDIRGWHWHHETDSRRSKRGLPDLIATRDGRLLMIELKSEHGKLRPAQGIWLALLRQVPGIETYLWRPSDWDLIEGVLL